MFKIKQTKRSSTNIITDSQQSIQVTSGSNKRVELNQNNDIINQQSPQITNQNARYPPPSSGNIQQPSLVRNTSLRPRSGTNNKTKTMINIATTNGLGNQADEMLDSKMNGITGSMTNVAVNNNKNRTSLNNNLKNLTNTIGEERPGTSSNNINTNNNNSRNLIKQQKKNRLLNRRSNNSATLNPGLSSTQNIGSIMNLPANDDDSTSQYISKSQAQSILLSILQHQPQYFDLKQRNQQQFQKNKQKLLSNISIILLKWYKVLQDRLFNQVKKLNQQPKQLSRQQQKDCIKQSRVNQQQKIPQTVQQLINQQIRKQFSKQKGLFNIQQRCAVQQSKLQRLIDKRLQRLESLLTVTAGKA